jgi:hypothetical protein
LVVQTIQNNLINGHKWTPEELDLIRVEYKGTYKSAELLARRITIKSGDKISAYAVKKQAGRLGLTSNTANLWSDAEVKCLTSLVGKYSMREIQRRLKHNGYKRTMKAIIAKMRDLGMQAEDRVGWFTKREASEILGVSLITVQNWIDCKALKASYHHGVKPAGGAGKTYWHIEESDLLDFILAHPMELTGRNINFFLISDMFKARLYK